MQEVLQQRLLSPGPGPGPVEKAWPWNLESHFQVILMQLIQKQSLSEQERSGESDGELGESRFWVNRSGVEPEMLSS